MRKATPVKSVTAAKRLSNCKLSIDGSKDERLLTNYTFMKNKTVKHDIIKMDDIAQLENASTAKATIKRLAEEAKTRREAMQIEDFEAQLMKNKKEP